MNELHQIFDTVNIGLVVMDKELKVTQWNRWMFQHSGIASEQIVGSSIFEHFPALDSPWFTRNCKAVLTFGNFSFFSQKLHHYLFPFKPVGSFAAKFEFMQQSCTMGPLRGEDNAINSIFVIVQDVTELATYEQKMMELNIRDGLTGIYNRRHFESRLAAECERHQRYDRKLSLIMIDIDFFKAVNDSYGHQCGDQVLREVASGIASVIRTSDCLARYGGEEFCCLLPETALANAVMLAELFRRHVEDMAIEQDCNQLKVTISLGVAEYGEMDTAETLLKRADEALYEAKRTGRNRTVSLDAVPVCA
jgi:diguanylate cyclase (GGDEF)-like protein